MGRRTSTRSDQQCPPHSGAAAECSDVPEAVLSPPIAQSPLRLIAALPKYDLISYMLSATQLGSGRAGIQTQVDLCLDLCVLQCWQQL